MADDAARADVLIRGGEIIDGSGSGPFAADVAIEDGRITAVGSLAAWSAARTIRANGLYITPGFVDMHTHSERGLYIPELAPSLPYLTQGVTTVVGGADGYGSWPLHETMEVHAARLERQGIGTNAVLMMGSGQVRRLVMGTEARRPTSGEMTAMKRHVREAMESGAWGLSSGLEYPPGSHADTSEVTDLASEAASHGGMYHTHMRSESDGLIDAAAEAIAITERSGAVGVLTHLKAVHRRNWGKAGRVLELIEEARTRGVRVYADQYPFADGEVPLIPENARLPITGAEESAARLEAALEAVPDAALLELYAELAALPSLEPSRRRFLEARPGLLREMVAGALGTTMPTEGRGLMELASWYGVHRGPGNPEQRMGFVERLDDPNEGARIRSIVAEHLEQYGGAEQITLVESARPEVEGKSLLDATEVLGLTEVDAAIRLGLEGARAMADILSQEDLEGIMRKDYVATGSDGDYPYFGAATDPMGITQHVSHLEGIASFSTKLRRVRSRRSHRPHGHHPTRTYASFSTKLRRYALDRGVVSLPHAIRSFTGLPAEVLGWSDRGLIRKGYWADIAVFDPTGLAPLSTVQHLHRYSEGMQHVLVNGRLAIDGGQPVGANAGRVLRIQER